MKTLLLSLTQKYPRLYEIFKFCLVGGLTTLIDMAIMALVIFLWTPTAYAHFFEVFYAAVTPPTEAAVLGSTLGFTAGVIVSFILSLTFVFSSANNDFSRTKRGFLVFVLLALGGLLIHAIGMLIGIDLLHQNEWLIKILLTLLVLVYNYFSRKLLLFKKTHPETASPNEVSP